MRRSWKVVLGSCFALCFYLTAEAFLPPARQPSAQLGVALIHAYQATGSHAMESAGVRCRYTPTCSHYAADAISYFGTLNGVARTAGRLWRCSPWGGCGYDPAVETHAAAYLEPQGTEAERKEQERLNQEQFKRVQENLSKPADQAAADELKRAMSEAFRNPPGGQGSMSQSEQEKKAREEAERMGRELGRGCAKGGVACAVFSFFALVGIGILVFMMVWTYKDAKARGDQNAVLWLVLIFFLHWIGFIIYMIARPKGDLTPCPNCKQKRLSILTKCPHCAADSGAAKPPSA